MPRLVHRLPVPRLHTPSGRARVRINGKDHWLGPFGSRSAQVEYDRLISDYLANGRQLPSVPSPEVPEIKREASRSRSVPKSDTCRPRSVTNGEMVSSVPVGTITITILIAQFTRWADSHYRHPDGTPTRETANFKHVTKPLRKMFGTLPVESFGPTRLIALRDSLIKKKLARRTINRMIGRVRMVFKFGVSRDLVPVDLLQRLQTVEPLQPGRGGRETSGTRGSVSWEVVQKTLPHLPPLIRALVVTLFHTGARVGELAKLTTGMIDRTGDVWVAVLDQHKNAHRGKSRRIFIGPKAQQALLPFLLENQRAEPIFSPLSVCVAKVIDVEIGESGSTSLRLAKRFPSESLIT